MSTSRIDVGAGLKLALLALWVMLAGLLPGNRAFTAAIRRAEAQRAAQEYAAALDSYRGAATLDPASPDPWQRSGDILLRQHRFAQAAEAFGQAAARGGDGEAMLGLGEAQAGRGDWAAALGTWALAQAQAPGDARVYLDMARAALAQGQFDAAQSWLTRCLDLDPRSNTAAIAHQLLGRLLIDSNPAGAAAHFKQAGDVDMLSVLDAVNAASSPADGGEADPARRPLLLGIAFVQRGELSLARRELERAIALHPESAEAYAYLGYTLDPPARPGSSGASAPSDEPGTTMAARQALSKALDLDPGLGLAYYFAAAHYRRSNEVEKAQTLLWAGLEQDPNNAALRLEMGEVFVDLHDYAGAEQWYQGAVQVAPIGQKLEFALALAHFYVDHVYGVSDGRAVAAAEAAAALAPTDARAQDLRGWAYYLAGRPNAAQAALSLALELDPGLVSAHYHLGSLYRNGDQPDLARQHLQRAADLDTDGYYRERVEALLHDLK